MNKRTGTVKFYNSEKAYGFIQADDPKADIFVHATGLVDEITSNDKVEFNVKESEKGPVAVDVKLID